MAFERSDGPIGSSWRDENLSAQHEQIQRQNRLLGAAHFTDRKHKKNPVPDVKRYPRPYEIFKKPEEDRPDQYDPEDDHMEDLYGPTFGNTEGGDSGDDH